MWQLKETGKVEANTNWDGFGYVLLKADLDMVEAIHLNSMSLKLFTKSACPWQKVLLVCR